LALTETQSQHFPGGRTRLSWFPDQGKYKRSDGGEKDCKPRREKTYLTSGTGSFTSRMTLQIENDRSPCADKKAIAVRGGYRQRPSAWQEGGMKHWSGARKSFHMVWIEERRRGTLPLKATYFLGEREKVRRETKPQKKKGKNDVGLPRRGALWPARGRQQSGENA